MDAEEWNQKAQSLLLGRSITSVRYMTTEESNAQMWWGRRGLILTLDDGTFLMLQGDDEGNGPGALMVLTSKGTEVLPVL